MDPILADVAQHLDVLVGHLATTCLHLGIHPPWDKQEQEQQLLPRVFPPLEVLEVWSHPSSSAPGPTALIHWLPLDWSSRLLIVAHH